MGRFDLIQVTTWAGLTYRTCCDTINNVDIGLQSVFIIYIIQSDGVVPISSEPNIILINS